MKDARILACTFQGPKNLEHRLLAEIDTGNRLYAGFKYVIGKKRTLHFSSRSVRHFRYDGKVLDLAASAKSDGEIEAHLGPGSDAANDITWRKGKDGFQFKATIESCKIASADEYKP